MRRDNDHRAGKPLVIGIDGNFLSMPHSGIGTYLRGLADALERDADALGIRLRMISPDEGRFLHPGSKAHRFAWDAAGASAATLRSGRPLPDLLHLPQMTAPVWSPVPVVATIHDVIPFVLDDYRASRAMRAYLGLMSRTVRKARRVIAPSESAASDVSRVLGVPAARIRVIPEAPGGDLMPSMDGSAVAKVRQRWGIEGTYLFNIGGFDRRKNLPLLVEAFAAALPFLPDNVRLVIAGSAHTDNPRVFPPLEPVIRRLGVGNRVLLTGRVTDDERRALYQAAHGYITPSMYEGFGLTPLEAMACGVPAIVANRTSLPEVVGDAGLIVEPEVDVLAEAMVSLLTDDDLHDRLSVASLDRVATFTWEAAARATVDVYREAVGAKSP
ncbi:MAG TPA: glycosyltransferase family 1 protein [Thermomicrobiales bacterium]|nr:glycosyltransferase family 1 protein [Thermomicrobiales bacterium]